MKIMSTTILTHRIVKLSPEFEKYLKRELSNVDGNGNVYLLESEDFELALTQQDESVREKYSEDIETIRALLKKEGDCDIWIGD